MMPSPPEAAGFARQEHEAACWPHPGHILPCPVEYTKPVGRVVLLIIFLLCCNQNRAESGTLHTPFYCFSGKKQKNISMPLRRLPGDRLKAHSFGRRIDPVYAAGIGRNRLANVPGIPPPRTVPPSR
jgi:hypothetical protein